MSVISFIQAFVEILVKAKIYGKINQAGSVAIQQIKRIIWNTFYQQDSIYSVDKDALSLYNQALFRKILHRALIRKSRIFL